MLVGWQGHGPPILNVTSVAFGPVFFKIKVGIDGHQYM